MWNTLKKTFNSTDSFISLALGLAVVLAIGLVTYNYFTTPSNKLPGISDQADSTEKTEELKPGEHLVKKGETLWSISEQYYKTGYHWSDIAKANNLSDANAVEEGQKIVIPSITPIQQPTGNTVSGTSTEAPKPTTTPATTPTSAAAKEYTVLKGDSLWTIAVKSYNDGYRWVDIARANNLVNPDVIHTGNVLRLP